MQNGIRPFQIAVFAFFGVLMLVAIILFMNPPTKDQDEAVFEPVEIWGTVSGQVMREVLSAAAEKNDNFTKVKYRQFDSRTFEDDLVNAIAEGKSPDALFIPHTRIAELQTKLFALSYETVNERDYRDRYIDGAEVFLLPNGVYGVPILVDPMVMYWNKDLFSSNNFASAPRTWEEIVSDVVPTIVVRDFNRNILLSPIAFGEYRNVNNAFAIISTLLLQGGSRMVEISNNNYQVELNRSVNASVANPFTGALEFYTSFATQNNPLYSWNRVQPLDLNAFAAGDLALYFGMGSEYENIARLNPNLNFDIADVPQSAGSSVRRTYGTYYGFAFPKAAPNLNGAYVAASLLAADPTITAMLAKRLGMAPVERAAIAANTNDPIDKVRYRSALIAHGWLSPRLTETEAVLQETIEDVLSVRSNVSEAVRDTIFKIGNIY